MTRKRQQYFIKSFLGMGNTELAKFGQGGEEIMKRVHQFENQFKDNRLRLTKIEDQMHVLIKKISQSSPFQTQLTQLKDQLRTMHQNNTKMLLQFSFLNSKRKSTQQTLKQMERIFTQKYSQILKLLSSRQQIIQQKIYSNWKRVMLETKKTVIMLSLITLILVALYFFLEKYGDNHEHENSQLIKIIVVVAAFVSIFTMIYLRREFWINLTKLWKYLGSIKNLILHFFKLR